MPRRLSLVIATAVALFAGPAQAGVATGLPWEAPLLVLTTSLTGPVLQAFLIIAILVAGLTLAFGEVGSGAKRMLQAVFGLSVAVSAVAFFPGFFGLATGAVF